MLLFNAEKENLLTLHFVFVYPDYQTELCFNVALHAILPSACGKCHLRLLLSVETVVNCVLDLKLAVKAEVVQSSD